MQIVQVVNLRFGIGVFDPVWLRHRLLLFRAMMHPALVAQGDVPFYLGVQIDERLPEPFRSELQALVASIPNATIRPLQLYRDRMADHRKHIEQVVSKSGATHFISTRCDDDDCLTVGAFAKIQSAARQAAGRVGGAVIGIKSGLRCAPAEDVGMWSTHESAIGIGLSLLQPATSKFTVNSAGHLKIIGLAEREGWDVINLDSAQAMWMYVNHKLSDTDFVKRLRQLRRASMSASDYEMALAHFPLDRAALQQWREFDAGVAPRGAGKITEAVQMAEQAVLDARARGADKDEIRRLLDERQRLGATLGELVGASSRTIREA